MMHLGDHAIIDVECYEGRVEGFRGADAPFFYKNKTPPWKIWRGNIKEVLTYRCSEYILPQVMQ